MHCGVRVRDAGCEQGARKREALRTGAEALRTGAEALRLRASALAVPRCRGYPARVLATLAHVRAAAPGANACIAAQVPGGMRRWHTLELTPRERPISRRLPGAIRLAYCERRLAYCRRTGARPRAPPHRSARTLPAD